MKNTLLLALVALFPLAACARDADVDDDAAPTTTGADDLAPATPIATPGMYTLSDVEGGFGDDLQPGDAHELNLREDGSWDVTANGAPFSSGTSAWIGEELLVTYETGACAGTEARFRSTPTETSITQTKIEAACDDVPERLVWTWVGDHAEDAVGGM
ncbi:MAG TPA: hypothetical protein VML95_07235 [Longimicrobiales bacterium]|nr:hypothetical protein [Longimicrobiales bacterium]